MPVFSIGFDASAIRPGAAEASRALDGVGTSAGKAEKGVNSLSSSFKTAAQTALAMVGAYKAVSAAASFINSGVEYNRQLESARLGITAVLASTVQLENAQGRLLEGAEKFAAAQQLSAKMAKALDVASMQSPAAYTDLLESFQTLLAPANQLGLSWQNTLDVTIAMSNTLAAMNIPMERLARETQAILTGKGLSQSDVAKRLGISKEEIASWGEGEQLMAKFAGRFAQMAQAGVAVESTYTAVTAYFEDSIQSLGAEIGKGYFESLKDSMLAVADAMFVIDEATKEFTVTEDMKPLVDLLQNIASWSGEQLAATVKGTVTAVQGLSSTIKDNRDLIQSATDAVPYLAAAYAGWFAVTRIGRSDVALLTKEMILGNQAKAQAAAQSAALAQVEHAAATAALNTAKAEQQRVMSLAASSRSQKEKAATARALVAAEAQVALAQKQITATATAMTAAQVRATAAARGLAATQGMLAAVKGGLAGIVTMLGGPVGIAFTAAAVGMYAFMSHERTAVKYAREHADALQLISSNAEEAAAAFARYTERLSQMNEKQKSFEAASLEQKIKDLLAGGAAIRDLHSMVPAAFMDSRHGEIREAVTEVSNLLRSVEGKDLSTAFIQELLEKYREVAETYGLIKEADRGIGTLQLLATFQTQLEALNQALGRTEDKVGVVKNAMAGMFNPDQAKGLAEAITDVEFKIAQLGRSAAQQATFEALRKAKIDLTKVSIDQSGTFSYAGDQSSQEAEQVNRLNILNAEYVRRKDATTASKKAGTSAAKDSASALRRVNDELAKATMTEAEYARYQFERKFADWSKDLKKVTPELEQLRKVEELALGAGYTGSDKMADHIRDVGKAIENMGLTEREKELKKFREEMERLKAAMAGGMETPFTADQLAEYESKTSQQIKAGATPGKNADALREFNREFLALTRGETEAKRQALDEQAELYRVAGADRLQVEQWIQEKLLDIDQSWQAGATRSIRDYCRDAADTGKQIENVMTNAFQGMEDALVDFCMTGKLSFSDLADSIIKDLTRIIIKKSMAGIFGQALGDGNGGGIFGSLFHSGGVVGVDASPSRLVTLSPMGTTGLPRYHSGGVAGIGPNERLAVLEYGEPVFTRAQASTLAPLPTVRDAVQGVGGSGPSQLIVHVHNNAPVQVDQELSTDTGSGMPRLDVFIDELDKGLGAKVTRGTSHIARAMDSTRGLSRNASLYTG